MNDWVQMGLTRPQSHTQRLYFVHKVQLHITLHRDISYLFFTFILETQTCCSFLKTLAVICPGLVRLELHCGFILPPSRKNTPGKNRERERSPAPNQLTAEPPHRCRCSLHPWSDLVSTKRKRRGWLETAQGIPQTISDFCFPQESSAAG